MEMRTDRTGFYDPETLAREVAKRIAAARRSEEVIDYVTFVPDGEPTLDANLGREITLVKRLGARVAVITNASLLGSREVRDELGHADWVSVKVDAANESVWHRLDRPHRRLRLTNVLEGIRDFAARFRGTLVSETMLVAGINDCASEIEAIAGFLATLRLDAAYIAVPTRPPAESWIEIPSEARLNQAYQVFSERHAANRVEFLTGYEGDAFSSTGRIEEDILGITAVHPMREDAVLSLVQKAGADFSVVERLLQDHQLVCLTYGGHRFYLRRFKPTKGRGVR